MTDQAEFILETWNGTVYEPEVRGPRREIEPLFGRLRGGKRIVRADKARPAKPVLYRSNTRGLPISVTDGCTGRLNATMQAYLAWAQRKGVPSLTFYDDSRGKGYARTCGKPHKFVNPSDFLGDAPSPEPES